MLKRPFWRTFGRIGSSDQAKNCHFPSRIFFSGGAERLIFEETAALEKKGYQVEAWAPLVAKERCFPEQIGTYAIHGFFPYLAFVPREWLVLLSCLLAPLLVPRFRKVDLFYGVNQAGSWLAFMAAKTWWKPWRLEYRW